MVVKADRGLTNPKKRVGEVALVSGNPSVGAHHPLVGHLGRKTNQSPTDVVDQHDVANDRWLVEYQNALENTTVFLIFTDGYLSTRKKGFGSPLFSEFNSPALSLSCKTPPFPSSLRDDTSLQRNFTNS